AAPVFRRSGTNWIQEQLLTQPDPAFSNFFSGAVDMSGDTIIIGATGDKWTPGSAYVFVRSGTNWIMQQRLTNRNPSVTDGFGGSVAIDGHVAVVGAAEANGSVGSAFVFTRAGTIWTKEAELAPPAGFSHQHFGTRLAIFGDRIVTVAETALRRAFLYTRSGTNWTFRQSFDPPPLPGGSGFPHGIALSEDRLFLGEHLATGFDPAGNPKANHGRAHIYSIQPVNLLVTKQASTTNLLLGTNLSYSITVANAGTQTASKVSVTDTLPSRISFLQSEPPATTNNGSNIIFDLEPIAPGSNRLITIHVAVTSAVPGAITNSVSAFSAHLELTPADNIDTAVTVLPDTDGDAIANPGDPDDDNDGSPDEDEIIANTHPTDPDSFLSIRATPTGTTDVHRITFPTSTGRTYRIESSDDLYADHWSVVESNLPGHGGLHSIVRTGEAARVYYRIAVESP
ncbi:MAG: hypothetical protein AAF492_22505, partial [Verrucomicrobiota bacterium]